MSQSHIENFLSSVELGELKKSEIAHASDDALGCFLLTLYDHQTNNEKRHRRTFVKNNCGFNAADGFILSKSAENFLRNGRLSRLERCIARKRLQKYHSQIFQVVENES